MEDTARTMGMPAQVEIHIIATSQGLQIAAPPNPLVVMKLLGDAMNAYVMQIMKNQQSRIAVPNGTLVDKRILENAK